MTSDTVHIYNRYNQHRQNFKPLVEEGFGKPTSTGITLSPHYKGDIAERDMYIIKHPEKGDVKYNLRIIRENIGEFLTECYKTKTIGTVFGDAGIGKSAMISGWARDIGRKYYPDRKFAPISYKRSEQDRRLIPVSQADDSDSLSDQEREDVFNHPEKYFILLDIRVSELTKDEIIGLPKYGPERERNPKPYIEHIQTSWVWLVTQPQAAGILFVDEMNQETEQGISEMCMKLFTNLQIKDAPISSKIQIVGAGNLGPQFTNVRLLPVQLLSRMSSAMYIFNKDEWLKYAKQKVNHPRTSKPVQRVHESITAFAESDVTGSTFLLNTPGTTEELETVKGHPTPRTLVRVSDKLYNLDEEYDEYLNQGKPYPKQWIERAVDICSECGVEWANKWAAFMQSSYTLMDIPTLEKETKDTLSRNLAKCTLADKFVTEHVLYTATEVFKKNQQPQDLVKACLLFNKFSAEILTKILRSIQDTCIVPGKTEDKLTAEEKENKQIYTLISRTLFNLAIPSHPNYDKEFADNIKVALNRSREASTLAQQAKPQV